MVWLRQSVFLALAGLLLAAGVVAQDDPPAPPRDPAALAARFLGYDGAPIVPELRDPLALGDADTFYAPKAGSETPVAMTAELVSLSPGVAVWADVALERGGCRRPDGARADSAADLQRSRAARELLSPLVLAGQGVISQPDDVLPVPDVDNDPHLNIVFVGDTGEATESFVRTGDSLPSRLRTGAVGQCP